MENKILNNISTFLFGSCKQYHIACSHLKKIEKKINEIYIDGEYNIHIMNNNHHQLYNGQIK